MLRRLAGVVQPGGLPNVVLGGKNNVMGFRSGWHIGSVLFSIFQKFLRWWSNNRLQGLHGQRRNMSQRGSDLSKMTLKTLTSRWKSPHHGSNVSAIHVVNITKTHGVVSPTRNCAATVAFKRAQSISVMFRKKIPSYGQRWPTPKVHGRCQSVALSN